MIYECPTPIAILLAVYNGEEYLRVQVDSIIGQTNQDWTLYIRDDNSTDSTREIIADYCRHYENVISIKDNLGNLGCYENFKQLLRIVEANYYMFSDADDFWLPEKVQVSYDFIKAKETIYTQIPLLAHCDKIIADGEMHVISPSGWKDLHFDPDLLADFNYIPVQTVGGAGAIFNHAAKSHVFEPAPFRVSHDGWLGLQTARYGKIFAIHQSLMIYRRHDSSVTAQDKSGQTFSNYFNRMMNLKSTFKYHWTFANQMQTLGYGGKCKYFYYRLVVFFKIMWGKLTIR